MAKRVLVTGSSRGIGRAIALRLAEDGWDVAVHYSADQKAAQEVVEKIENCGAVLQSCTGAGQETRTTTGGCLGVYQADLSDPQNATQMIDKVISEHGLDALVNNAGIYRNIEFLKNTEEEVEKAFEEVFNVNWHSPRRMIYKACQHFKEKGKGKVLNVCSRVAHRGEPRASCYSTSKAALLNLTRSLAVEHAKENIQHFAIAPGWVDTAMAREGMDDRLPQILSEIPQGRMATPEECAGAAAYLLSDEASYLSGTVLDVNGASYLR